MKSYFLYNLRQLLSSELHKRIFWEPEVHNIYIPTVVHESPSSCDCNLNGGQCENGLCVCKEGFYGDICEYSKCKRDTPQFFQCNHGTCLKHFNKTDDFKCLCDAESDGALCETHICKDFCYNNGHCSYILEKYHDKTRSLLKIERVITCECISNRFSGVRCEFDNCYLKTKENTCPSNCTLDDSCKCLCGKECDDYLCHNEGQCSFKNDKLGCK